MGKNYRKTLILSVAVFMAGCATASKTYAPDGREAFTVDCSGAALNWGYCQKKAGELCAASGYDVLDRSSDQNASFGGGGGVFGGGVANSRSMLIACR
jgi:hypothetical protein